ncbi:TetR/AcrR family transcriptional regulator [Streptomyces rhizosphaerihabitans]|uniref:TetR/AcrR family transcriptional regulator n=1 Tax=Streptomyces rhizosphaerihabitans TaxID=1266770 RepID=UPI0021BE8FA3|nr:TetR family transcriptional regulator [Streptomyces rhizosphaerihabitans]MCT9007489.1 TetR family transcriptional regulator [Streptomyces rhizosphaerihabitans]
MNKSGPRRGRRPGGPDTRVAILDVARRRFLEDGYHAVTLRSIAGEAEVDLALISYYFGSKKGLFGAALALGANPAEVLARVVAEGDLSTFPERVIRQVLAVWDDPVTGPPLLAMLKSAIDDDSLGGLVKEAVEREIVDRIAGLVQGREARQRAASFTTVVAGLIATRYLLRLEPIVSMTADEVVRFVSPQLRQALRGPGRPAPNARPAGRPAPSR